MKRGLILLSCFLILCVGCKKKEPAISYFSGTFLNTPFTITIAKHLTQTEYDHVDQLIKGTLQEIDSLLHENNPKSEISSLNALKPNEPMPLSHELETFLISLQSLVTLTQGCFDPVKIGWKHIHFRNGQFYKDQPKVSLRVKDLIKGYGVDLLIIKLFRVGYRNVLVEWGMEKRSIGQRSSNNLWTVYVPALKEGMNLKNQAITSRENEKLAWTVSAPTCTAADAIAICLATFSSEADAQKKIEHIKQKMPQISYWVSEK